MRTLFNKHFWTLNVAAMAARLDERRDRQRDDGSLFVAPERPRWRRASRSQRRAKKVESPLTAALTETLTERNIFDLNPREDEVAAVKTNRATALRDPESRGSLKSATD